MKKYSKLLFPVIILLAAVAVRYFLLTRDLEYDEIWSLENYSKLPVNEIFSDLATPNNHPVNTLLIKFLDFNRSHVWCIRLGSLLFSLGSIYLLWLLGKAFYRRHGGWYALLAGAFLPPLVVAGTTARGYAGQLFFLLLFSYALIRCRKGSIPFTFLAAASGLLAILCLPSSILYIVPPGIFFIAYLIKKRRFNFIQTAILFSAVIAAAWWYLTNWQDFAQTQQFKVVISNWNEFYQWLSSALSLNGIWLFAIPFAVYFKRKSRICWILLTIIIFPLLAALFTSAAPARVYLPGFAAGVLLFIPQLKTEKYKLPVMAALLIMQFAVSFPVLPDNRVIDEMTGYREIQGIITVYGANESYPVAWNHPELIELYFQQINKASEMESCALLLAENKLSGVDSKGNTVIWEIPGDHQTISGERSPLLVNLQRITRAPADTIIFAVYPPMEEKMHRNNIRFLGADELIYLNCWLTVPLTAPDGSNHRYALIAFKLKEERFFPPQVPIFTFAIEK